MGVKQLMTKALAERIFDYAAGNPETNVPKLLGLVEKLGLNKSQAATLRKILNDPDNNWYKYIMSIFNDIDNEVIGAIINGIGVSTLPTV